jgi:hypothetical protein
VRKASSRQRKIWYRSRLQTVSAALLVAYLILITLLVTGLAGVFRIGLLLSGAEALIGALLLVSLSPVLMIRSDLIRIWHGYRFTNIGIGEVAGIGLLYTRRVGRDGDWRCAKATYARRRRTAGTGPRLRTSTRWLPSRSPNSPPAEARE